MKTGQYKLTEALLSVQEEAVFTYPEPLSPRDVRSQKPVIGYRLPHPRVAVSAQFKGKTGEIVSLHLVAVSRLLCFVKRGLFPDWETLLQGQF
jgi:hypothetical protein